MPLDDTRVAVCIAQEGQDGLEPRFPIEGPHCEPRDSPLLSVFVHLPLGQARWPAEDGTSRPALRADRVTTSTGCQDGRRITRVRLSAERRQMPCSETAPGVCDERLGLRVRARAAPQAHDQLAVRRSGGVLPPRASHLGFVALTALLLVLTTRHCSANARALGVNPGTC